MPEANEQGGQSCGSEVDEWDPPSGAIRHSNGIKIQRLLSAPFACVRMI